MHSRNTENRASVVNRKVAVLASGGLDSAVILTEFSKVYEEVHPLYVRCGLFWERTEQDFLREFLARMERATVKALQVLEFPMVDLYRDKWYASGKGIPGYYDADEDWEIPGRNIVLLAKAAVWCQVHSVDHLALGSLGNNPFPDASSEFFELLQAALAKGLGRSLKILCPLSQLEKAEVIRLGNDLPLEWTLSCANPIGKSHCGQCGKCRERITAFLKARVPDLTTYASIFEDPLLSQPR